MLVRITLAGEAVLTDTEDFRRFSIRFDPGARGTGGAEAALGRVAPPDGDAAAWVSEEALRRMAPRGGDPEWEAGLARMIAFARSRGWVDEQGGIRAHIEAPA
jgi:hypothetical protein